MTITAEELISSCLDELQLSQRYAPYVKQAEETGYPQLARLLRARVASETAREALLRHSMVHHTVQPAGLPALRSHFSHRASRAVPGG